MMSNITQKKKILIVDDSILNRELLSEILGNDYEYLYADDGIQAIELLHSGETIDIILLDINMPRMDGFEVLRIMNEQHWIDTLPVVVISAESDVAALQHAYDLGVTDYISRPYIAATVQNRVANSLKLYSKQKTLVNLAKKQTYEREKINNMLINIFSHAVESRNRESGNHTLHIQTITNMLLHRLVKITDKYPLSESDIAMISLISALHDIGKIDIPKAILNKPGKLTPEEWEIMKSHTIAGDEFLNNIPNNKTEKFVITAHEICRWHHERWDGNGYPDGLAGDNIPISAQIVSLADVYDALTSERCYKKAVSHKEALRMICNGECGVFNPICIQCLIDISDDLLIQLNLNTSQYDYLNDVNSMIDQLSISEEHLQDERSYYLAESERAKKEFFAEQSGGIQFEYDRLLQKVLYITQYDKDGNKIALQDEMVHLLEEEDWTNLQNEIRKTTRSNSKVSMCVRISVNGHKRWQKLSVRTIWTNEEADYISLVGHFRDIHNEITRQEKTI